MSNLIPEVRTDKNGNAVTRWIRSLGKKSARADLPAPALKPTATKPRNEQAVMELCGLLQPNTHYDPLLRLPAIVTVIADNDMELLQRITRAVRDSAVEGEYWEAQLEWSSEIHYEDPEKRDQKLNECRMALSINPLLRRIIQHDPISYMHKIEPTLYLDALAGIMEDGGIANPPENLARAVTMINYVKQFHLDNWKETGGVAYDSIAADAAYIADRIDQVEKILPELRARESHDRETIELLLNNDVQVLREGEL